MPVHTDMTEISERAKRRACELINAETSVRFQGRVSPEHVGKYAEITALARYIQAHEPEPEVDPIEALFREVIQRAVPGHPGYFDRDDLAAIEVLREGIAKLTAPQTDITIGATSWTAAPRNRSFTPAGQPDADGWIAHTPGECPVPPETKVKYRLHDGYENEAYAESLSWCEAGLSTITHYQIVKD